MKEQTIYFQDHRGVIRSMSSEAYEKFRDGQSGESVKAERKDSGNTEPIPAREGTPETHHQKPIRGLEKKAREKDTSITYSITPGIITERTFIRE